MYDAMSLLFQREFWLKRREEGAIILARSFEIAEARGMERWNQRWLFVASAMTLLASSMAWPQQPPPDQTTVDVSGKWTIYSRSDDGKTATKTMDIKQKGNTISGHFKGPNQSGGIEGTIDGNHVVIRTKTYNQFTFRGHVEGDSMKGHWGIFVHRKGEMHGEWEARRSE